MILKNFKFFGKLVQFITFVVSIPLIPGLFLIVASLGLYRSVVSCILRYRFRSRFAGMVTGTDAMWGLDEKQRCSGVVNVLAFVNEVKQEQATSTPVDIIGVFRQRLKKMFASNRQQIQKAFFKRNCSLGYFFWTEEKQIDLESFIQPLTFEVDGDMSETEFRGLFTEVSNKKLPNYTTWQLFVGMQSVTGIEGSFRRYPIIFRFHHSIGDGISLLRFFLKEIDDSKLEPDEFRNVATKVTAHQKLTLAIIFKAMYSVPYFVIRQFFSEDELNCLQRTVKTSEQIVCWQNERNVLLEKCWNRLVKNAKRKCPKVQYSSTLLAALSGTLGRYFEARGQQPPSFTVSMPTRIKREGNTAQLGNKYTAQVQELKISFPNDTLKFDQLLEKLNTLKHASNVVRTSSDLLINYWALTVLPSICPIPMLRFISEQFRITVDVSIMPELRHRFRIGRHEFGELYFWSPLFGNTGVNISALCYGGELRLALLADRSVIGSVGEGQKLLDELFREIQRMDILLK